jgi:hypothetical protein
MREIRLGAGEIGKMYLGDKLIAGGGDNVIINSPVLIIANNTKKSVKGTLRGDTYEEDVYVDLNPGQVKFINVDTNVSGRIRFNNNIDCHISGMYYDDNEQHDSLNEDWTNEIEVPVFNYYWACCVVLVINNYYTT